jgi:hypothetical protein
MDTAYISHLTWIGGGYVDVYGIQADGGQVFLRRINTRQIVENTNEGAGGGNSGQHDGSTITLAATGLSTFTAIRLDNKLGRFHLSGMSFSSNRIQGAEGTGMVHPAQLSFTGADSGLNADLLDGNHASAFVLTSTRGVANGVATLDDQGKILVAQLPNSVFDSLYFFGVITIDATLNTLANGAVLDAVSKNRSPIGYYWVVTATSAVVSADSGVQIGTNFYTQSAFVPAEEGNSISVASHTLEVGDWVVITGLSNEGTSASPYAVSFATVNNTYELASTTIDGIVRLSNTTTISSATTGSQVITQGVLGGLIGTAANTIAAGNHTHTIANITNLQTSLDAKLNLTGGTLTGKLTVSADADNEQILIRRASNTNEQLILGFHSSDYAQIQAVEQSVGYRTLALNPNGGNVGIGTTSPVAKLAVKGAAYFADDIYLRDGATASGDVLVRIYDSSDDGIIDVYRNNSVVNRIHGNGTSFFTAGNVGIGTTAPVSLLNVNSTGRAATIGGVPAGVPNGAVTSEIASYLELVAGTSGGATNGSALVFHNPGVSTASLEYKNANANLGYFNFRSDNTEWRVGIGTTSPTQKLDVVGNTKTQNLIISDTSNVAKATMTYDSTSKSVKFVFV